MGQGWQVTLGFGQMNTMFTAFGAENTGTVVLPGMGFGGISVDCDEAMAKKWDKRKPGMVVPFTGTIASVSVAWVKGGARARAQAEGHVQAHVTLQGSRRGGSTSSTTERGGGGRKSP